MKRKRLISGSRLSTHDNSVVTNFRSMNSIREVYNRLKQPYLFERETSDVDEFISREEAIDIVSALNVRDVIVNTLDKYSGSTFHEAICWLDLKTGEVFYNQMGKNESFQDGNRFIGLYSIDDQTFANMSDDDIAGDDSIPDGGVEEFDDYDDRVIDVLWYYEVDDWKSKVVRLVNERYDELERYYGN